MQRGQCQISMRSTAGEAFAATNRYSEQVGKGELILEMARRLRDMVRWLLASVGVCEQWSPCTSICFFLSLHFMGLFAQSLVVVEWVSDKVMG